MRLPKKEEKKLNKLGNNLDIIKICVKKSVSEGKKKRTFYIPSDYAKEQQRKLLNILCSIHLPDFVFSQKGTSYIEKVDYHLGDDYLLNLDIKDFFPSIYYQRVKSLFVGFGILKENVKKLTFLTTCDGHLPQGFVTSPLLSNLVFLKLDLKLNKYCYPIKYSRYVDDLSFSFDSDFSEKISKIVQIIKAHDFNINDKTQFFSKNEDKFMHGLKLGEEGIEITRKFINKLLNNLKKKMSRQKLGLDVDNLNNVIRGELEYLKQVDPKKYEQVINEYSEIINS
jgi:hypothetical protein